MNRALNGARLHAARYRLIFRWHFYAGLFCIPFILWLAVTGSIYLFKPQIEAWLDRPYAALTTLGPPHSVAEQIDAARRAVPGSQLRSYQLPDSEVSAVQILVSAQGATHRVYVDRRSLAIVHREVEDARPMRVLFHLHGDLLIGDRGSMLVELAASWGIVMILTGWYLFWPRTASMAGLLYPRFNAGRTTLRDIHAVTGMYVSAFALFFFISGLPWTSSWGGMLKTVRAMTTPVKTAVDWPTGHGEHDMQGGMQHMTMDTGSPEPSLDRLVALSRHAHLAPPVLLSPPSGMQQSWTLRSDAPNRPLREHASFDAPGTKLVDRQGFGDLPAIDRVVAVGVAAHEGQLFGPGNQLLGLISALALILVSSSALVLWWRRRRPHTLGAPESAARGSYSFGLISIIVVLAILLPMLGASLLAVTFIERLALRRISWFREFFGLETHGAHLTVVITEEAVREDAHR